MPDLTSERRGPEVHVSAALRVLPPTARYVLRGPETVRAAAGAALGVEVPASACRASVSGTKAALWLGPDEWLLLVPPQDADALSAALAGHAHSLVDVGHRQAAFEVHGPDAAALLAAGCPLDLDPGAFPVGMCTRTMLAKAEVILWRTGPQVFRLEVWRSFAAYVGLFLAEAGHGL
jgi:sarcosine oxidase, subunit gamma